MGLYTFLFEKLSEKIKRQQDLGQDIRVAFIQRHADKQYELLAHPVELNPMVLNLNAKHIFFQFNGDKSIICIEDYKHIDVDEQSYKILETVHEEFVDDFIDDSTSSWRFLIFDDVSHLIYELKIVSMQILTNEEEAILQCEGCRKRQNKKEFV